MLSSKGKRRSIRPPAVAPAGAGAAAGAAGRGFHNRSDQFRIDAAAAG
ncbi:hypothetical protein OPKNFCMD_2918 [Methylobacterium crusticola]|uniref:Uncharacterized protein n=1 Tax=Methylobacterium crusticola TaxID=1697972 RepID=A0ABQ4QZX7_9HYPH|nr:hypothetical protein OPKNFCMD_2918 [Methylobacterium crusticola]